MQIVSIDIDHDNFFCPVTGNQILGAELFEPSAATVFAILDESCTMEHGSEEHIALWDSLVESEEDAQAAFEKFREKLGGDSTVCFSITTHGMACGPVSSTIHIAIDFNYIEDETDKDVDEEDDE
jgi:hypothetical protein